MSTAAGGAGEISQLRGPSPPAPSPAKPPGDPASQSAQPDLLMPLMPAPHLVFQNSGDQQRYQKSQGFHQAWQQEKRQSFNNDCRVVVGQGWRCWGEGVGGGVRVESGSWLSGERGKFEATCWQSCVSKRLLCETLPLCETAHIPFKT